MNKSQRIYLNINSTTTQSNVDVDKHIKIRLEQNVDTLEFLTLSLNTENAYQNFNADYGVLIGRVIANNGIGIPNAKISIFIPLSKDDENNSDIVSVYPYKTPRDKNLYKKRYNLLPRVSEYNPYTGVYSPRQPFGSFFLKQEILTNELFLNVYQKYYKYSTVTNEFGDYMIFGVPVGTHIVHMSVDITDIGKYSMNPASMVTNLGYSPNLFTENNTRIKESDELEDLPHIDTQEITVDIIPFWGDSDNFEIGITRQDFRIKAMLTNQFTIFGSVFTDDYKARRADKHNLDKDLAIGQLYRISPDEDYNVSIRSKRIAKVTETIYYYPNDVTDDEIQQDGVDLYKKALILDPSQYTVYKRNGDFVFIINCNRKKVITSELGSYIEVPESYNGGVYTEFKGFVTFEITEKDLATPNVKLDNAIGGKHSVTVFRTKIKIPQNSPANQGFFDSSQAHKWRNYHYTFKAGNIYSVSQFYGTVKNSSGNIKPQVHSTYNQFASTDDINNIHLDPYFTCGIIKTTENGNDDYEFPSNGTTDINKPAFGANWLNFTLYLPQMGYVISSDYGLKVATYFTFLVSAKKDKNSKPNFYTDDDEPIGANETNLKWFLRSDLHWTNFILVTENDIKIFYDFPQKGGHDNMDYFKNENNIVKSNYMYGEKQCPYGGGKKNGIPSNATDNNVYFYKGFGTANCIEFVKGILNIK